MGVTRFYHPLIRTVIDTLNSCNPLANTNSVLACLPKSNFFPYFFIILQSENFLCSVCERYCKLMGLDWLINNSNWKKPLHFGINSFLDLVCTHSVSMDQHLTFLYYQHYFFFLLRNWSSVGNYDSSVGIVAKLGAGICRNCVSILRKGNRLLSHLQDLRISLGLPFNGYGALFRWE